VINNNNKYTVNIGLAPEANHSDWYYFAGMWSLQCEPYNQSYSVILRASNGVSPIQKQIKYRSHFRSVCCVMRIAISIQYVYHFDAAATRQRSLSRSTSHTVCILVHHRHLHHRHHHHHHHHHHHRHQLLLCGFSSRSYIGVKRRVLSCSDRRVMKAIPLILVPDTL